MESFFEKRSQPASTRFAASLILSNCKTSSVPTSIKVRKALIKLKQKLMFNSIIRYVLQTYYILLLSTMFNMQYTFGKEGYGSTMNTSISIGLFALLAAFALFSYKFMQWNAELLGNPKFKASFGSIYLPGECYNHKGMLMLPFLFCVRRFFTALVIVCFSDQIIL